MLSSWARRCASVGVEDVVLLYEQLHEIERVNRDLNHTVDVRPIITAAATASRHTFCGAGQRCCLSASRRTSRAQHGTNSSKSSAHCSWGFTPPGTATSRRPTSSQPSRSACWTLLTSSHRSVTLMFPTPKKA